MTSRDHAPTDYAVTSGQPHTPGPWIVEATATDLWVGYPKAYAPKVSEVVCHFDVGPRFTEQANARRAADARLIAAAPDLLAALRDAYRFITQPQRMDTPKDGPKTATYRIEGYNALTTKLRAAIAKAEGK